MRTRTSRAGNSGFFYPPAPGASRSRDSRGFTLLELLFVLFIVAMASTVVVFSLNRLHERTIFNDEARRMFQTVRRAREMSLLDRMAVVFRVDEDLGVYWLDHEGAATGRHPVGHGYILSGKDIVFFPKGNSSGGLVKINDGKGREYSIEVDPVLGTAALKRL